MVRAAWLAVGCAVLTQAPMEAKADPAAPLQPYQEYKDRIKQAEQVAMLTDGLMGDSISLYNGATEFAVTDISIPGNSALPVALARRLKIDSKRDVQGLGGFGIWDMDVPYIYGVFDGRYKWNEGVGGITARCSGNFSRKTDQPFEPRDIGGGVHVHLPGAGDEELSLITGNPQMNPLVLPSDGRTYRFVTKSGGRVRCLEGTSNGYFGEGFEMRTPDGLRYTFDIGLERYAGQMKAPFENRTQTRARIAVYLMASRVEDRFGNSVTYEYTGDKLTAIRASDGRLIELFYDGGAPYITRARTNGRQWSYSYTPTTLAFQPSGLLNTVTLPDSSTWKYQYLDDEDAQGVLVPNFPVDDGVTDGSDCRLPTIASDRFTLVANSPSGARGTFTFTYRRHKRSGTPASACTLAYRDAGEDIEGRNHYRLSIPDYFDLYSITSKQIDGIGIQTPISRTYSYPLGDSERTTSPVPCTTCSSSKTVTVTAEDGTTEQYVFGILYGLNDGRLLETRTLDAAGAVVRRVVNDYVAEVDAPSMPFADIWGVTNASDDPASVRNRPLRRTDTVQDGVTFTRYVNAFDVLQRPVSTTQFNTLGKSRVETVEYADHLASWTLGQIQRRTLAGIQVERTDYSPATALPSTRYSPSNSVVQRLSYNADGTLSTVTDARNLTTTLGIWKRGVPQSIRYPATPEAPQGAVQAATVDDNGWVTSVTNEEGHTTGYGYDAMGRVNRVSPPALGSGPSNPTLITYEIVAADEYGIPPGHWRRFESTGTARKLTYFDSLWRPIVEEVLDYNDATGTNSWVAKQYDNKNRPTFVSYPRNLFQSGWVSWATVNNGTHTEYDALGRVTQVKQDSELGPLTTTTTYLPGLQTRVRNPRNQETTTSYEAYDAPSYEQPLVIQQPKGVRTEITRNAIGNTTNIVRSGPEG